MPLRSFLDLSTAHLPVGERDLLEQGSLPWAVVTGHDYGWWVSVPADGDEFEVNVAAAASDGMATPALARVVRHARSLGAAYVNLDRDAEVEPLLAIFDDTPATGTAPDVVPTG